MTELHPTRDWLESVPEFEAPTDEEVQLEVNMMSRFYGTTRLGSAGEGNWADYRQD